MKYSELDLGSLSKQLGDEYVKGFGYYNVFPRVKRHLLIILKLSNVYLAFWHDQIHWFPLDGYYLKRH